MELEAALRVAASQRSVAMTEAGSGMRHGFRAIVRDDVVGTQPSRDASVPQLEGEVAAQAERDALEAYVAELHNGQPTERHQWDAREDRSRSRRVSLSTVASSPELLSLSSPKPAHSSSKKEKRHRQRRASTGSAAIALSLQQCELAWALPAAAQACHAAPDDTPAAPGAVADSSDSPPRHRSRRHSANSLSSHTRPNRDHCGETAPPVVELFY